MKKFDTVMLIVALVAPLIPAVIMGFTGYGWYYFATVMTFYACFGFYEFLSKKFRDKTISQDIASTPTPLFWSVIGTWTIMHLFITLHWVLGR